jgi:predicted RNA-binding protein Jag
MKKDDTFIRLKKSIAWRINRRAILIPRKDFIDLVNHVPGLTTTEKLELNMFANEGMIFSGDSKAFPELEQRISDHLKKAHSDGMLQLSYVCAGKDAVDYISDYLACYQHSYGMIRYSVEHLDDHEDDVITIELCKKPNLAQRIIGRCGTAYDSLKFLKRNALKIMGPSLDFYLDIRSLGYVYHFSENGVSVCTEPELERLAEVYDHKKFEPVGTGQPM